MEKMDKHCVIKHDKNFMEYPLWFIDYKEAEKVNGYTWKDTKGYIYRSSYKFPTRVDFVFLLYLLMKCQKQGWSKKVVCTKGEILRNCGMGKNPKKYERVEDSLRRWKFVGIEFSGIFFNGINYETLHFGIINDWGILEGTKRIEIEFNEKWLLQQSNSNYFKLLDFEKIKRITDPLATRLYEILIKQFYKRNEWKIDAVKLAAKIPMAEKYPSHIVKRIGPAVKRISDNTELQVTLTTERQRGKALFIFVKDLTSTSSQEIADTIIPREIITLIPEKHRNSSLQICELIYNEKQDQGACLVWLINYVNEKEHKNFGAYLRFAYEKNIYDRYLEEKQLEEEFLSKQKEVLKSKKQEQLEKEEADKVLVNRYTYLNELINSLSIEEKFELNEVALQKLKSEAVTKGGKYRLERYLKFAKKTNKDRAHQFLCQYQADLVENFSKEKNRDL